MKAEVERLLERLTSAEQSMAMLEAERERERKQLSDEIAYLRQSLTTEGEERRKLTAILTDQRTKTEAIPVAKSEPIPERRGILGLFGRRKGAA